MFIPVMNKFKNSFGFPICHIFSQKSDFKLKSKHPHVSKASCSDELRIFILEEVCPSICIVSKAPYSDKLRIFIFEEVCPFLGIAFFSQKSDFELKSKHVSYSDELCISIFEEVRPSIRIVSNQSLLL